LLSVIGYRLFSSLGRLGRAEEELGGMVMLAFLRKKILSSPEVISRLASLATA
jgi:hypothetical protein